MDIDKDCTHTHTHTRRHTLLRLFGVELLGSTARLAYILFYFAQGQSEGLSVRKLIETVDGAHRLLHSDFQSLHLCLFGLQIMGSEKAYIM